MEGDGQGGRVLGLLASGVIAVWKRVFQMKDEGVGVRWRVTWRGPWRWGRGGGGRGEGGGGRTQVKEGKYGLCTFLSVFSFS